MNKNTITAIVALVAIVTFAFYYFQYTVKENVPGENSLRLANKHLEDGNIEDALAEFQKTISINPDYKSAHLGLAIAFMQLNQLDEAQKAFDRAIIIDESFAEAYANRGILNDRAGRFKDAVSDYRMAFQLKPELLDGPGYLWQFLHNVDETPPTLLDRADYIEKELTKPEGERLLNVPELDAKQRMYKK
ncbi:MAG: tetratricopeptide repeat protein [Nitrospira sp.]|nr:tetratricopeptide repeat protein [bacterium]MBL7048168.1 tetratricopeptide repeat protein [Nitrospira sp.]